MTIVTAVLASLLAAEQAGPTLTRAPELVESVPAEYPPDAAAARIEGSVALVVTIGDDGAVLQAVVADPGPHPGFAPAALHAVQQFRFRPAEIDGTPAAVEIEYRYHFVLPREAPRPPLEEPPPPDAATTVEDRTVEPATPRADPFEAVVRAERRREVTVRTLAAEEVRTVPGTQGDALRVLQNLPGVARSPFGIGQLVVRGSEPAETPVYVDGVPIPQLFHFGGISSVVNADVVESIDLFPGNFSSRFGRGLGGTVDLRTREGRREWHGAAQVDVLDGRVEVEGPVRGGSAYAAVRRSWMDAALAVALPRVDPDAANELRVAPRYWDWQAKLTLPTLGGRVSVFAFGSDDRLEFVKGSDDPGRPTLHVATRFWRVGASHRVALGRATNEVTVAAGRDAFDVLTGSEFGQRTEALALSLRDTVAVRISSGLRLEAGVDGLIRRIELGTYAPPFTAPGTATDPLQDVPETIDERAQGWWTAPAAWVEADWRAAPRLRLVGGVRADAESRFGRAKVWIDPRLSAFLEAGPSTTLVAAAGLFGSSPDPQTTSATFGNPDLEPERSLHLSLGARRRLPWDVRADVTGFYKQLWSLAVPTGAVGADGRLLRYSSEGRGETVGLELLLKRDLGRGVHGWLAWTWSRSLRRDDPTDPSYPSWRPFVLDQTHVLALVLSYRLRNDWMLGTRVRAVTGNPVTPASGAVLDADSGLYRCIPGAPLSSRLPGFFQADARLDKRFVFESWMMSVYLDVQNVTNRENAELRLSSYDCSSDVPLPSIPVFPSFGVRAEW